MRPKLSNIVELNIELSFPLARMPKCPKVLIQLTSLKKLGINPRAHKKNLPKILFATLYTTDREMETEKIEFKIYGTFKNIYTVNYTENYIFSLLSSFFLVTSASWFYFKAPGY